MKEEYFMGKNGKRSGRTTSTATFKTADVDKGHEALSQREQSLDTCAVAYPDASAAATEQEYQRWLRVWSDAQTSAWASTLAKGEAAKHFREGTYYAPHYPSFESFCDQVLRRTSALINYLIAAFELHTVLTTIVVGGIVFENEYAARPLTRYRGDPKTLTKVVGFLPAGVSVDHAMVETALLKAFPSSTESASGDDDDEDPRAKAKRDDRIDKLIFETSKLSREVEELAPSVTRAFVQKYINDGHMLDLDMLTKSIRFQTAIRKELRALKRSPVRSESTAKAKR